jgi:protein TonB
MKIKKNPDKDLSQYSLIFFQIGLIIALSFSLFMIERKTPIKEDFTKEVVDYNVLEQESVPITEMKSTPPPPPPPPPALIPESFQVVDDDADIEEVYVESTETDQEESVDADAYSAKGKGSVLGVSEVGDVEEEIEDVPFSVIETVPIFPGCERLKTNEERKRCMSEKVNTFMHENFNMKITEDLELSGIHKIFVRFKIDNTGSIVDVQARAPHPKLQEEGVRVVKMLPQMKPGEQRGRPVGVLYGIPITIQIKD